MSAATLIPLPPAGAGALGLRFTGVLLPARTPFSRFLSDHDVRVLFATATQREAEREVFIDVSLRREDIASIIRIACATLVVTDKACEPDRFIARCVSVAEWHEHVALVITNIMRALHLWACGRNDQ